MRSATTAGCSPCCAASLPTFDPRLRRPHLQQMRHWLPWILGLTLLHPAGAQRTMRLALGVTRSTDLARDAVLDNTALKLGLAPSATVGLAFPINAAGTYRLVMEAAYGTSKMTATDSTGGTSDLGSVATITVRAMLDGRVRGALRWQAGAGILFYRPASRSGVFLNGAPHRYLVTGGMSWTHPLTADLNLLLLGRYSFQEFITPILVTRGYSSYQSVHRLGLHVGVERRF